MKNAEHQEQLKMSITTLAEQKQKPTIETVIPRGKFFLLHIIVTSANGSSFPSSPTPHNEIVNYSFKCFASQKKLLAIIASSPYSSTAETERTPCLFIMRAVLSFPPTTRFINNCDKRGVTAFQHPRFNCVINFYYASFCLATGRFCVVYSTSWKFLKSFLVQFQVQSG